MFMPKLFLLFVLSISYFNYSSSEELSGKYVKVGEVEVVWQSHTSSPIGFIFAAHGCAHSSTDWFPKTQSCPTCIGLPVEVSITKQVLKHGYVIVAVSSIDRFSKCWTEEDVSHTAFAVKHVYKELKLDNKDIPLFALGASSGGYFVGLFGKSASQFGLHVSAIAIQISALMAADPGVSPVVFVHMAKDRALAVHIGKLVRDLVQKGVPAQHFPCRAKRIDDLYF